jgi:hypothetical protein
MRLSPFSILVRQNIPSRLNPRQRTLGRQADVVPQSGTESPPSATPTANVTATAAARIVPHSFLIFVFSFESEGLTPLVGSEWWGEIILEPSVPWMLSRILNENYTHLSHFLFQ